MNIYKHELKANLRSTILWICVMSGIAIVIMSFYTVLKNDMEDFMKLLDNFPPAMKAAFGLVAENFLSPIGFYAYSFTYTSLFGVIQAMNLGVGIVSKEERERTADFLMTKPVSRTKVLTSKLLAAMTIFIMTNVIYTAISASTVSAFSDGSFETGKFALINISLFFLQLIFFSIGLAVSIAAKKIKSVLPVSLGLVFVFYAISAFAVTADDDKLRFITPFQYFKTDHILAEGHYELVYTITGLVIVAAGITISYAMYKRKDIHAV